MDVCHHTSGQFSAGVHICRRPFWILVDPLLTAYIQKCIKNNSLNRPGTPKMYFRKTQSWVWAPLVTHNIQIWHVFCKNPYLQTSLLNPCWSPNDCLLMNMHLKIMFWTSQTWIYGTPQNKFAAPPVKQTQKPYTYLAGIHIYRHPFWIPIDMRLVAY